MRNITKFHLTFWCRNFVETKKAKETNEEKRISQENRLRKINLRLPG